MSNPELPEPNPAATRDVIADFVAEYGDVLGARPDLFSPEKIKLARGLNRTAMEYFETYLSKRGLIIVKGDQPAD